MTERSYSVATLIAIKLVVVLLAVGTYLLWRHVFDLSQGVSIVGAIVIWCMPPTTGPRSRI